jgi:hypothetical protein
MVDVISMPSGEPDWNHDGTGRINAPARIFRAQYSIGLILPGGETSPWS